MKKILVLYSDAGHGHRKVAEALAEEIQASQLSDLSIEVEDALNYANASFRYFYPRIYFCLVRYLPASWGFFFFGTNAAWLYPIIQPIRSIWNWCQSFGLRKKLKEGAYDYILFTHFFPAEVSASLKKRGRIKSTLITIVTDVIPHRVWANPGTDFYWVMAEESKNVLKTFSVAEERIEVGGIPISKKFLTRFHRPLLETKFGLQLDRFTILFTSGSFGLGPTEQILRSLQEITKPIQVLVVCGNNQKLYENLNRQSFSYPIRLFGFVDNMHELMAVSDLVIAKPGGATMCESLALNLPMVMTAPIPGQESGNVAWLRQHEAAYEINGEDTVMLMTRLLNQPDALEQTRKKIAEIAKPHAASQLLTFILSERPQQILRGKCDDPK